MPAEFFQLLGIDAPPEKGNYIIDLSRYLKEQLKIDSAEEGDETQEQLRRATQRPWTPKDYPNLAAWLKANEKPLAVEGVAVNFVPPSGAKVVLEPGADGTLVREEWDPNPALAPWALVTLGYPHRSRVGMRATLERLDALVRA
jgi:hypothetical protein